MGIKTKWTVAILFIMTTLLSSCTTEEFYDVAPNVVTKEYRVYAEEMVERTDIAGTYYEYEISEPSLTQEIMDYGIMVAYLCYSKDGKNTLTPLPLSDFLGDTNYNWQEQFTIEFQVGRIKFVQKISDHSDELPIAEYYDLLIRFLW